MRIHAILFVVPLIGSVAVEQTRAAIPMPRSSHPMRARVVADAKAAEPTRARVVPALGTALEADPRELLQRVIRERDHVWHARLDELDARIYELVGRLQLLAACLTGLLLAMFVWLASVARQVVQLVAGVRSDHSGGFG